jgi:hypothetical protein
MKPNSRMSDQVISRSKFQAKLHHILPSMSKTASTNKIVVMAQENIQNKHGIMSKP